MGQEIGRDLARAQIAPLLDLVEGTDHPPGIEACRLHILVAVLIGLAFVFTAVMELRLHSGGDGPGHQGPCSLPPEEHSGQDAGQSRYPDVLALFNSLGEMPCRDMADFVADDRSQFIELVHGFDQPGKYENMTSRRGKGI